MILSLFLPYVSLLFLLNISSSAPLKQRRSSNICKILRLQDMKYSPRIFSMKKRDTMHRIDLSEFQWCKLFSNWKWGKTWQTSRMRSGKSKHKHFWNQILFKWISNLLIFIFVFQRISEQNYLKKDCCMRQNKVIERIIEQ